MRENNLKSAIIVSSAYHIRRAKMAFQAVGKNHESKFFYHPVTVSFRNKKIWWMNKKYFFKILEEYTKLIASYVAYNIL